MWTPNNEFTLQVSEKEKRLYEDDDPHCIYYSQRWLYRKGRHNKGEFPVVVVRKHLIDNGYRVWVSGQSKQGIDAFILAMFPNARLRRDQSYLNTIWVFSEKEAEEFIRIVEGHKKNEGIARHGGDPDLLVQNIENPADKFFVEVKAEDLTGKSRYKDKLNKQQLLVFPLIEKHLKCQVRIANVQIMADAMLPKL
jgi:hypothetical protein